MNILNTSHSHASAESEGPKLPLHIIMNNSRLRFDDTVLEAMKLVFTAYPEAASVEIDEDRLILRVGGPTMRVRRKWTPYKRAAEDFPHVHSYMENKLAALTINCIQLPLLRSSGNGAYAYYAQRRQKTVQHAHR
jgi:hypothetical protein